MKSLRIMRVTTAREWHINADEPALFDPDSPYLTSDHDPVIVGLDLIH